MRAIVEIMKGSITLVACLVATSVCSAPSSESATYIELTLASVPSISIDGPAAQSFVDPWGKPYGSKGFVVWKKNQNYRSSRKLFDTPDSAMRLQQLRFDAILRGNLLPAINPELKRAK